MTRKVQLSRSKMAVTRMRDCVHEANPAKYDSKIGRKMKREKKKINTREKTLKIQYVY